MAHLHEMRDSDNHFIIDPATMVITNKSKKHKLQQGDHNSEIYSFEIPRLLEGHDMTLCNLVQIHYINIKTDKTEQQSDVYKVTDMVVCNPETDTLVFTWTVHGNATKFDGSLNFRIHFYCINADGEYTYKKHTEIFKGISISEGFDNAPAVEKDHSDILSQWEARMDALESGVMDKDLDMGYNSIKNVGGITMDFGHNLSVAVQPIHELHTAIFLQSNQSNEGGTVKLSNIEAGTNDTDAATVGQLNAAVNGLENTVNRVTTIDKNADDDHYPTAKAVVDYVGQNGGYVESETEQLTICYTTSYPDLTTFEYTERASALNGTYSYVVVKQGTIQGGLLSVDFDVNTATEFDLNLYLFDADGNPYLHSYAGSYFEGELFEPKYIEPGTGAGFGRGRKPFTVQIPDGCTFIACMRSHPNNTVSADGSITTTQDFANWAVGGGITFTVTKEGTAAKFVEVEQGVENANRYMVTDANGNIVTGDAIGGDVGIIRASINPNIKSINHRGYSTAPENTLSAYRLSKKMGFDAVECDVRYTSDGIAVLLHDADIKRTSDGEGNISELTYEQAYAYDFGSWKSEKYTGEKIPTFEEFIRLCRDLGLEPYVHIVFQAEDAQDKIAALVNTVKRYGMNKKVTWLGGGVAYLNYVKMADSTARIGLVLSGVTESLITSMQGLKTENNYVFLDVQYTTCTEEMVEMCIEAEIPLEFWNIDTAEDLTTASPYVTGFTTDTIVAGVELYKALLKTP